MGLFPKSAAVGALLWICACGPAMSQVMILTSQGPSSSAYPGGTTLQASSIITLRAGDRVEILDAKGSHVLIGPRSLQVSQIDQPVKEDIRNIFSREPTQAHIGAVRGFTLLSQSDPSTLWQLRVGRGQTEEAKGLRDFCTVEGQATELLRASTSSARTLLVSSSTTGARHEVAWPEGAQTLAWPTDRSVSPGGVYTLGLDGEATTIRLRSLPQRLGGLTDLANALFDAGCYDQLKMLEGQLNSG